MTLHAAQRMALLMWALAAATGAAAEQIVTARYAEPVTRYGHFALGPPHEYAQLVATTDAGRELTLALPADAVFEDLAPRPVRLRADGTTELLVIVSTRASGSALALAGLHGGQLQLVARAAPIGTPNRWLNPVGAADLDGDGSAEIAAVTTPHIGGVLRVYQRRGAELVQVAAQPGFSNHVYGSTELGLSTVARVGGRHQLLVPDARRASVRTMALIDGQLVETASCPLAEPITRPDALRTCGER